MNYINSFQADLLAGQQAEQKYAYVITTILNGTNVTYNTGTTIEELRGWDIKYTEPTGEEHTVEVKWDKRSTSTGNFAIEYKGYRGRRSGLAATTAYYWVILSGDNFYKFITSELINFMREHDGEFRSVSIDNDTSFMYLVPIDLVSPLAEIININN